MQEIISVGKDTQDAIQKGLIELNTTIDKVKIEVLETSNKGIFGIFGQKDAKVLLKVIDNPTLKVQEFLEALFEKMRLNADVECEVSDDRINVVVSGEDMGIIIGRRGETLDAIQHIAQLYVNKQFEQFYKVVVDTESYRAKREEALINLANGLAKKVLRTKKEIVLEPMKAYERRIIHTALQNYNKIKTHSVGEEPNRKIIVSFKYPAKAKEE